MGPSQLLDVTCTVWNESMDSLLGKCKKRYVPLLNSSVKSKELKESVLSAINQKIYFPFLFYCCPWFICEPKESITWRSLNDKIGPAHLYAHETKQAKEILCIWVRLLKWAGRSQQIAVLLSTHAQRYELNKKTQAGEKNAHPDIHTPHAQCCRTVSVQRGCWNTGYEMLQRFCAA